MRSHFLLLLPLESSTNVVIPNSPFSTTDAGLVIFLGIGELSHLHLCKLSKNLIPSLLKIGEPIKNIFAYSWTSKKFITSHCPGKNCIAMKYLPRNLPRDRKIAAKNVSSWGQNAKSHEQVAARVDSQDINVVSEWQVIDKRTPTSQVMLTLILRLCSFRLLIMETDTIMLCWLKEC